VTTTTNKLLEIQDLRTYFNTPDGVLPAVDGVSFDISVGETLCVVGESGCGKSVTALSTMRLVRTPPARFASGQIKFEGRDMLKLSPENMRKIRGRDISMIFQEPMSSLNPVHTVGRQLSEAIRVKDSSIGPKEANERAVDALRMVMVPDPKRRVKEFPHQMSGGMRQRVMIAMALACRPKLLIADEPTTALDVTVQAQILSLMQKLKQELGTAMMFITHDLGVVAKMAQRVVVMYAGKVVEEADVITIFREPLHPYTQGLLTCIPRIDHGRSRLSIIEGSVPSPLRFPQGCRFHPRCPKAHAICREKEPSVETTYGHKIACWLYASDNGGER
jgi:oligopeptide/dipeptide ABC transporter ATP-binding protein